MEQYRVPIDEFTGSIKPWQVDAFSAFDGGNKFHVARWHRRARKSTCYLNLIIRECVRVPGFIYGIVGPTYEQVKKILWRDEQMLWRYLQDRKVIPWRENKTDLFIKFDNGSTLMLLGADKPDSLRGPKFKGLYLDEYAFHTIDSWEHILQPTIEEDPDAWAIFGSTPNGNNHFKARWDYAENKPGWYRSVVKSSETDIYSIETLQRLKEDLPRAIFDQEYECSFITEEERTLITSADIEELSRMYREPNYRIRFIVIDPSLGHDECVIYVFENGRIIDSMILHERDTMRIVAFLSLLAAKHKIRNIGGDVIGIGAGIFDRLNELGYRTFPINSAESSSNSDKWFNKRAEIWWKAWETVKMKKLEYPQDAKLRKQITNVHFEPYGSRGTLKMEDKDKVKKRIEESPDRADCWVMGCYLLGIISPEYEPEKKKIINKRKQGKNAMAA